MINNSFQLIWESLPLFLQGMLGTVELFLLASALSIILGICFGIFSCDRLKLPILSKIVVSITFIFRAVPFFVQLLIVYFMLPELMGLNLSPFMASVIALGFCSSGYIAQFIQGGIDSVPLSHWESAFALGYSKRQTLVVILFPQVLCLALPALNNELEALLKSTAIASSIGMLELT